MNFLKIFLTFCITSINHVLANPGDHLTAAKDDKISNSEIENISVLKHPLEIVEVTETESNETIEDSEILNSSSIQWNVQPRFEWAKGCKFDPFFIIKANAKRSLCGHLCVTNTVCSHFTWTPRKNGTCFMGSGSITKENATVVNSSSVICGVVVREIQWQINVEGDVSWSCQFPLENYSQSSLGLSECAKTCFSNPNCTHFDWRHSMEGACNTFYGIADAKTVINTGDPLTTCAIKNTVKSLGWLQDDGIEWSRGCAFNVLHENLFATLGREECRHLCKISHDCNFFVWSPKDGGTCYSRTETVTKEDSFLSDEDTPSICGIKLRESFALRWITKPNFEFTSLCQFDDVNGSKVLNKRIKNFDECWQECQATINCTHFEVHEKDSCVLKSGSVGKTDAKYNKKQSVCGIMKQSEGTLNEGAYIITAIKMRGVTLKWATEGHISIATSCNFGPFNSYKNDWSNNIFMDITTTHEACVKYCQVINYCTHFQWQPDNGGTCVIKGGDATVSDAIYDGNSETFCGLVNKDKPKSFWQKDHKSKSFQNSGCSFNTPYFTYRLSDQNDCANICAATDGCSHFEWKIKNIVFGICFLKSGKVTTADAFLDKRTMCGLLVGDQNIITQEPKRDSSSHNNGLRFDPHISLEFELFDEDEDLMNDEDVELVASLEDEFRFENLQEYGTSNKSFFGNFLKSEDGQYTQSAILCEGQEILIACPFYQLLHIEYALYGRLDSITCGTMDKSNDVCYIFASKVEDKCSTKNSCKISSIEDVAEEEDPCPGKPKFILVEYVCRPLFI